MIIIGRGYRCQIICERDKRMWIDARAQNWKAFQHHMTHRVKVFVFVCQSWYEYLVQNFLAKSARFLECSRAKIEPEKTCIYKSHKLMNCERRVVVVVINQNVYLSQDR